MAESKEVIVLMGDAGLVCAAGALTKGDLITVDSAGKAIVTAAAEAVWFACTKDAVAGDMVALRKERIMRLKVEGHDGTAAAAIAVGDGLTVAAGKLRKAAGAAVVVAKALEAVGSGVTAQAMVLVA